MSNQQQQEAARLAQERADAERRARENQTNVIQRHHDWLARKNSTDAYNAELKRLGK